MEEIKKMIKEIGIDRQITLEEIPDIDLYIDQVIQLFDKTYSSFQRNEDDKVLTKTMINNYAKAKIFFPIKNKKYSKEHIILISLIYQLKSGLTLNDIKATLQELNHRILQGTIDLEAFYQSYLNTMEKNVQFFTGEVEERMNAANEEIEKFPNKNGDYLQKLLYITSFISMSNFYRRLAEEIVDELIDAEETGDSDKKK